MIKKIILTALLGAFFNAPAILSAAERFHAEPIHWAAFEGNLKKVKKYIAEGVDVNIQSSAGGTALVGAAASNFPDICEVLLEAGADPGIRGDTGWTALMFAELGDNQECIDVLLRHGTKLSKLEREAVEAIRPDCSFESGKAYGLLMSAGSLEGEEEAGVTEIVNLLSGSCPEFLRGLKKGIWQGSMAGLVIPARYLASATRLRGINAKLKKLDALADTMNRGANKAAGTGEEEKNVKTKGRHKR